MLVSLKAPILLSAACVGCAPLATRHSNDAGATQRPTAAPDVDSGQRKATDADALVSVSGGDWTAGIRERAPSAAGIASIRDVRAAKHVELDRVVFEFDGDSIPGYHVEYIDRPVRHCASGEVVALEGDAWLEVRFEPARAHSEDGRPLIEHREQHFGLPIVREIELTCDFEADVTAVIGVARPNDYRLMTLASPPRLVVDIRHAR